MSKSLNLPYLHLESTTRTGSKSKSEYSDKIYHQYLLDMFTRHQIQIFKVKQLKGLLKKNQFQHIKEIRKSIRIRKRIYTKNWFYILSSHQTWKK